MDGQPLLKGGVLSINLFFLGVSKSLGALQVASAAISENERCDTTDRGSGYHHSPQIDTCRQLGTAPMLTNLRARPNVRNSHLLAENVRHCGASTNPMQTRSLPHTEEPAEDGAKDRAVLSRIEGSHHQSTPMVPAPLQRILVAGESAS